MSSILSFLLFSSASALWFWTLLCGPSVGCPSRVTLSQPEGQHCLNLLCTCLEGSAMTFPMDTWHLCVKKWVLEPSVIAKLHPPRIPGPLCPLPFLSCSVPAGPLRRQVQWGRGMPRGWVGKGGLDALSGFCSSGVFLTYLAGLCGWYCPPHCAWGGVSFHSSFYLSHLHAPLAVWRAAFSESPASFFFSSVAACQRKHIHESHLVRFHSWIRRPRTCVLEGEMNPTCTSKSFKRW